MKKYEDSTELIPFVSFLEIVSSQSSTLKLSFDYEWIRYNKGYYTMNRFARK